MRIQLYTSIILLAFALQSSAQTCAGNLGENIFTEGDFGSGTANVVQTDPQIAPGYIYTTDPPNDGFYTITNDIAVWPQAFGWIEIMDNSPDPEGYMMVVNASYEPGLFYRQEITGLCENTLYEFSADIINLIRIGDNLIKPNVSFLIDGIVQYETGDIPETEEWETYGFTFTTQPGQTSVILSLRNNAPGGIGNDIALDNISFRACGPQALILPENIPNICDNGGTVDLEANIIGSQYLTPLVQWQISLDSMTWMDIAGANDNIYTHTTLSEDIYYYRYILANDPTNLQNSKCRIVSDVKVIDVASSFSTVADTLCAGLSFSIGNNTYTETGIYVDTLSTAEGCDSIVTLDLTILPDAQLEAVFNLTNPTCSYFQDGSIVLENVVNGVEPFSVFIDNMLTQNGSKFNLSGGDYSYRITDKYGCSTEGILTLETPIPFRVDLGDDINIQLGETVILNPDFTLPVENFTWEPTDLPLVCDPDCNTPSITPTNSLTISINATSTMACMSSDSLRINVGQIRDVFIPNVFSPNSDGQNDYFLIFGNPFSIQEIERLTIYDRWGGLVFEQNNFQPDDPTMGWDGTFKGQALNPGVYVYEAQIRFLDGQITKYAGGVTLIR